MSHPAFFDAAPVITVRDPLAEVLGAAEGGLLTYRYMDAVRLAGHSCPTVAGAYLMTRRALAALYPAGTPERGNIGVRFSAALDEGAAGVIGSVVSLVTGAAGLGGFKGIGRRYRRQNLMYFACAIEGEVQFERLDNRATVSLGLRLHTVPPEPGCDDLLKRVVTGEASPQQTREFGELWQARVRRILIDHADDPQLISLRGPG